MTELFTNRPPPRFEGGSQRESSPSAELAAQLRHDPLELDDVTRARMERNLVQAWRMHGSASVELQPARRSGGYRHESRRWLLASIAASAMAGGIVAFFVAHGGMDAPVPVGSARFELRIGDAALQSGSVVEGQLLESGPHGAVEVDMGSARVQMGKGTRLRFERMSARELRLSLQRGLVEVDFHPEHKGDQTMVISSGAADVRVIGTRFVVAVDAVGNTEVRVLEGLVEVVPRSGSGVRRVAAGERTLVRVDEGDASERAVRDAIELQLGDPTVDGADFGEQGASDDSIELVDDEDVDMSFDIGQDLGGDPQLDAAAARSAERALSAARKLLRAGRHVGARERLRGLVEGPAPKRVRVEALTLIAESHTAQGDIDQAADAYERADALAPNHTSGDNARFARARLLERHAHDEAAASDAYRRYLERAPEGALASQARHALCRLGSSEHCD